MAKPMTRDQWPADIREYRDKLDAFNLAVGKWLGLDPEQVFRFDLTEGFEPVFDGRKMLDGEYTCVTWESTTKQEPRLGHVQHGVRSDAFNDLGAVFTAELLIDWQDDRERIEVAGRKPRMFSESEEARLRAMFL